MFCPNCGTGVGDNARFCPKCGAQVIGNSRIDHEADGPLLYQSKGCTSFHRGLIIFGTIFGILFGVGVGMLSLYQVEAWQIRPATAEEKENYEGEGVLGGSIGTVSVDAFDEASKAKIQLYGAGICAFFLILGGYSLKLSSKSKISVYRNRIEGVPYSHGLLNFELFPGFTSIDSNDISSVNVVNRRRGAIRIQTKSGRKESFFCTDVAECFSAIQSTMR